MINVGQPVPAPWEGAIVIRVDDAALAAPTLVVAELHRAWVGRLPVVVELGVDPVVFRDPRRLADEPWRLAPEFEPWSDRLHFLVWANTYDARSDPGPPVWWWARKAARLRGVAAPEGDSGGDVRLADGTGAWIDGGPRASFSPEQLEGLGLIHRESVERGTLAVVPPPVTPRCRPGARPAGRRRPSRRRRPDHRSGRIGQDAGADRAAAPPPCRPRLRT